MFDLDLEGVDPGAVPKVTLATGKKMPAIGLGTFGSDRFTADQVAEAVGQAARVGYRHFDCAAVYGNQREIGKSLSEIIDGGIGREDLWVTSKLWNDKHTAVEESCRQTLSELRLDYLDLFLVHWPFPNYHPPGCDVTSRSPDAQPYIHENFLRTWREMERMVEIGLVRNIGTSNMTIPKLRRLLDDAHIRPAVNEMELHPHFQQNELFDYVRSEGILPIGYCPIGSPNRPDRDKTDGDTVDVEDPVVVEIARQHGVHPAIVCIKWAFQRGQVPIPFSVKRQQMIANLRAVSEDPLTAQEMQLLSEIDQNCRLIKGQVFLWKEGQTWEDLWDESGVITPP